MVEDVIHIQRKSTMLAPIMPDFGALALLNVGIGNQREYRHVTVIESVFCGPPYAHSNQLIYVGAAEGEGSNPLRGRNQQFPTRSGIPVAPILAQAGWAAVGTRSGINQRLCSTELFFAYLGLLLNLRSHQSFLLARTTKSSHLAAPSSSVYLPNAAVKASANLFLSIIRSV